MSDRASSSDSLRDTGRVVRTCIALLWLIGSAALLKAASQPLLIAPISVACLFLIVMPTWPFRSDAPGLLVFGAIAVIRYVLLPTFILLTPGLSTYALVTDRAVLLMTYEELVVLGSLLLFIARKPRGVAESASVRVESRSDHAMMGIVAVAALAVVAFPHVLNNYHTVLSPAATLTQIQSETSVSGLVSLIVNWGRLLLPVLVSSVIIRRMGDSRRGLSYLIVVCAFLLLDVGVFLGVSRQSALVPGLASLFYLLRAFPERRRATWAVMLVGLLLSFTVMTAIKADYIAAAGGVSRSETTAASVEAYFNGYSNLEQSLAARDAYKRWFGFHTVLNDILGNFPGLRMDLTDRTTTYYNYVVYGGGPSRDQIIPFTGQAIFHWSWLFCWIPMITVVFLITGMDSRFRRARSPLEAYLSSLSAVLFGMAFMLNMSIIASYVYTIVLPGMIVVAVAGRTPGQVAPQ